MLAKKFLYYFLAPLMLVLAGIGILFYQQAATRLQEQLDRNLLSTTDAINAEVSARIQTVLSDLEVITSDPAFSQYFQLVRFGQLENADRKLLELQASFLSVAALKPSYLSIRLLDTDGSALTSILNGERSYKAFDASSTDWFLAARVGVDGATSISSTPVTANGERCIVFSRRLNRDDRPAFLALDVGLDALLGELIASHADDEQGFAYIVDCEGRVLVHPHPAMIGKDLSEHHATRRARAGYRGIVSFEDESGTAMRAGYSPLQALNMTLIVAGPASQAFAPLTQIRNIAIPLALISFLSLVLIGRLLVSKVIDPLHRLTQVTARISSGDLTAICEVKTGDEIELLAESFNTMARNLSAGQAHIRESTDALRLSRENLRITLDSIGDGVIATDREGRVRRLNRVAEQLTGMTRAEADGLHVAEVFRIVDEMGVAPLENPAAKVLRTGLTVGLANGTVLTARDGTERQIADSGAPIRDKHGTIVGVVIVFRDVTEQHRLEQQRRQGQKLESVGRLAGGVAHDFNNLLTVIRGNSELLIDSLSDLDVPEDVLGMLDSIIVAAGRGSDLTSQLLTFSRKRSVTPEIVDVHEVIDEVLTMTSRTFDKRVRVHVKLRGQETHVLGDRSMLQNALLNLALNARDAMPEGGVVEISTRNVSIDEFPLEHQSGELSPGSYLCLTVADAGKGIDEGTLEHIFEPFFTTKDMSKGTGLGLAAVYGTVAAHGGAIEVESVVNEGTSMHVYLPIVLGAQRQAPDSAGEAPHGEGRLLLVDDELAALKSTSTMLERLGYDVQTAEDGNQALEHFMIDPGHYDLVLLDMIMPGENGRDVLRRLMVVEPNVRVLLVSGYTQGEELDEALELGALGLLRKPFGMLELARAVEQSLAMALPEWKTSS